MFYVTNEKNNNKHMKSQDIRNTFLNFFEEKKHSIVPSAPMVLKDDPTLMFVNSGMAPFKEFFLGMRNPRTVVSQIPKNVFAFLVSIMIWKKWAMILTIIHFLRCSVTGVLGTTLKKKLLLGLGSY
jgi:hypothetical protein